MSVYVVSDACIFSLDNKNGFLCPINKMWNHSVENMWNTGIALFWFIFLVLVNYFCCCRRFILHPKPCVSVFIFCCADSSNSSRPIRICHYYGGLFSCKFVECHRTWMESSIIELAVRSWNKNCNYFRDAVERAATRESRTVTDMYLYTVVDARRYQFVASCVRTRSYFPIALFFCFLSSDFICFHFI